VKKVLRIIFFLFVGLVVVSRFFSSADRDSTYVTQPESDGDYYTADTLGAEIKLTHHRIWKDFDGKDRNLRYSISSAMEEESFNFRNAVEPEEDGTEKTFWKNFYFGLYDHDKVALNAIQDSICSSDENLEQQGLMYKAVSMIQDIPYHYILPNDSCDSHTDFPCVPLQRYGVLSPVEFLYTLSGDCDTRTVLLFTLLKKLGFDPIIVNSAQYRHSMLAVDVPAEGDYFIHKGRKFYFWETTATGWLPGMLPPDMNNIDYWTIILDYEFQADPTRAY
jgi:hypothetical protein